jgi:phage head maturation protease
VTKIIGPKGWHVGMVERRYADTTPLPLTYNAVDRTVDAVISKGSPVARFYGTEILRIDPSAVIVDRLIAGGIPLLDSHNQGSVINALGRVVEVWFDRGALMGRLQFNETRQGAIAQGMVARGEISGISAGYRVEEWEIADEDGNVIDPETDGVRWDANLTFTAARWELLEASLVSVPADADAAIRSLGGDRHHGVDDLAAVRARMWSRQRMHDRQQEAMDGFKFRTE